ncbi:uncharacterized protein [Eulemur rufifrons]|uniref:uncharacterized protein n=1 Tax=Eulemur rufifrons TaxID=859984 RepID=UPI003742421F
MGYWLHKFPEAWAETGGAGWTKHRPPLYIEPWRWPVAYLSKKLDPVAAGWPACLRIIAATALLVKDADKLTLGQHLYITTPHAIEGILKQLPGRWITNSRLTHYQGLLLDTPRIEFWTPAILNPATLLPDPVPAMPEHSCLESLVETQMAWNDLQDRPLANSDLTWFTDGSSFVQDGHSLPPPGMGKMPPQPDYSSTDIKWATEKLQAAPNKDGWFQDGEHRLTVPETLGNQLLGHLHRTMHLGKKKMLQLLAIAQLRFKSQEKTAEDIVKNCCVCQVMQPGRTRGTHTGTRERGRQPGLF